MASWERARAKARQQNELLTLWEDGQTSVEQRDAIRVRGWLRGGLDGAPVWSGGRRKVVRCSRKHKGKALLGPFARSLNSLILRSSEGFALLSVQGDGSRVFV